MGWYSQLLAICANPQSWIDYAILISWGGMVPAVCAWAFYEILKEMLGR